MKKTLSTKTAPVDVTDAEKIKYSRDFIRRENNAYSPDHFFVSFNNHMTERVKNRNDGEATDKDLKMYEDALSVLGLETHVPVAESVGDDYRLFITEMIRRTVQEYGCTTAIEISLAQTIALAHVRVLCLSKTLSAYSLGKVSVNDDINDFYRIISKELDRAQRQMTSAIFTLRQLKTPQMSFNIKAKTAFIAHNQQINDRQ